MFPCAGLSWLCQQQMIQPPCVVYHENVGSNRGSPDVNGESNRGEGQAEEILVDKHIILVEDAVGEIVAVCSDNSESFERNNNQLRVPKIEERDKQIIGYH
ncbi:uncharacterized protein LOC111300840 [Durio zibethinus]|uniref:Uncharacterized protein LOC111300840 n=1 Tax=Durio zibethinus TaxID=66656 RepID=A0A6P5ZI99_DURZI|nr:uncharacterized protein LOC111300840 [Durio zibethinus]